jgi:IS30 family transposase
MYHHLTKEERDQIAVLYAEGQYCSKIALQLGRHKSTISRETRRNMSKKGTYFSNYAYEKSNKRKPQAHKRKRIANPFIKYYVEEKIILGWSPDIISGRIKKDMPGLSVSHEAIYQYIYYEKPELGFFLPRRRIKRRPKSMQRKLRIPKIPNRIPITERPSIINDRKTFGHFESDSLVSRQSKTALNVLVERKSRYTLINMLESKTAEDTLKTIITSLSKYTPYVGSITYDNGCEFTYHELINQVLSSESYFCQAYHSWRREQWKIEIGLLEDSCLKRLILVQ